MPSKPVDRVLERLENVAEISAGWTARCPAHRDHCNSLSVAEGFDGKALVFCHAGCKFRQIVAALGLGVEDLFPQGRKAS
jgi:putative DNA primase/helicase